MFSLCHSQHQDQEYPVEWNMSLMLPIVHVVDHINIVLEIQNWSRKHDKVEILRGKAKMLCTQ